MQQVAAQIKKHGKTRTKIIKVKLINNIKEILIEIKPAKMNRQSLDIKQDKLEKLKQQFPEVFTEDKVDWEKLKATLGEDINFSNERYVLNWAGKSDAFRVLQTSTTATLIPDKNESVNFNNTEHVFIEGENLEVLKVLQKSYYCKVKMIYIDPPYNTGNDNFIYPDKFSESKEEYLKRIGDKDEAGYLLKEGMFRKNSKDSGHYHSNWLSMMYPRLFLAKNLLRDDGVIFVSIDDNEAHNLRLMMNEIFGEENFVGQLIWKKKAGGGSDIQYFAVDHEYVLVYAKNESAQERYFINMSKKQKAEYKYEDKNSEKLGPYKRKNLYQSGIETDRPNLRYPIIAPDGEEILPPTIWRWSKERFERAKSQGKIDFLKNKKGEWQVYTKMYLHEGENGRMIKPRSILCDVGFTRTGNEEVKRLFGAGYFDYPKPTGLIKFLMKIITLNDDIILDFFAGSATTAHAVLDLNKEDGGNRKFIMVQMPEKCDEKSEAYKAGYKTIADIGKERIRRVIKKIKENGKQVKLNGEDNKLDLGFKVFKLTPSNFKIWRGDLIENGEDLQKQLEAFVDPVREGASEENMLFELLLKFGYDLNSKIEEKSCEGINYYSIDDGEMIIALAGINEKTVKEIVGLKPMKVICLDRLFENNDQLKTNTVLQMKDAEIKFKTI